MSLDAASRKPDAEVLNQDADSPISDADSLISDADGSKPGADVWRFGSDSWNCGVGYPDVDIDARRLSPARRNGPRFDAMGVGRGLGSTTEPQSTQSKFKC